MARWYISVMKKNILPVLFSIIMISLVHYRSTETHSITNDFLKPRESIVQDSEENFEPEQPIERAISPGTAFNSNIKTYFQNLYDYSPVNSAGSCGYVSLIQYMSFYDTFFNDNIIPDIYDRHYTGAVNQAAAKSKSPGVLRQNYPSDGIALRQFVEDNASSDFQARCMQIYNGNANSYDYRVGMYDYETIFDGLYGANTVSFNYVWSAMFSESLTDPAAISGMEQYIKANIDQGKPVIIHIATNDNYAGNHSVVAYYYDNAGIHCNFGWGPNDTDRLLSNYYVYMAGVADFSNIAGSHSNNYQVGFQYYCGCGEHYHNNFTYSPVNGYQHRAQCSCGYSKLEYHIFEQGISGRTLCRRCNYEN